VQLSDGYHANTPCARSTSVQPRSDCPTPQNIATNGRSACCAATCGQPLPGGDLGCGLGAPVGLLRRILGAHIGCCERAPTCVDRRLTQVCRFWTGTQAKEVRCEHPCDVRCQPPLPLPPQTPRRLRDCAGRAPDAQPNPAARVAKQPQPAMSFTREPIETEIRSNPHSYLPTSTRLHSVRVMATPSSRIHSDPAWGMGTESQRPRPGMTNAWKMDQPREGVRSRSQPLSDRRLWQRVPLG